MKDTKGTFYPENNQKINTHTRVQSLLIKDIKTLGTSKALEKLAKIKRGRELSYPKGVILRWEKENSKKYCVELSESADFNNVLTYITSRNSLHLNNLKVGQTYFWRVDGGETRVFNTENNKYRFIKVNGAHNVRDVGGINIKQGLVYRGSDIVGDYKISNQGKKVFCEDLKIKTEINLRKDGPEERDFTYKNNFVKYVRLPYRPYIESFEEEHKNGLKEIMNFLSKEENYPVYIHCIGGADRTGMIAIFLRAILDESDEDILIDYELTSLSNYALGLAEGVKETGGFRNRKDDYFQEFLLELNKYAPNKPLKEQIKAFLIDCGITTDCMDKIVAILKSK